jgi:hypothetical protein
MKKLLSLLTAITIGLAVSAVAQTTTNTDEQQSQLPASKGKQTQQTTDQPAGPSMGHSSREATKDTSQPTKMKSGAAASSKTQSGATVQSTTVFRNGKQTSERLTLHQGTRDRTDVHFGIGTHPRDWWLRTYSIVLISGCHYYLADDGCWYPAFGFDPSCNFPEGVVYCD